MHAALLVFTPLVVPCACVVPLAPLNQLGLKVVWLVSNALLELRIMTIMPKLRVHHALSEATRQSLSTDRALCVWLEQVMSTWIAARPVYRAHPGRICLPTPQDLANSVAQVFPIPIFPRLHRASHAPLEPTFRLVPPVLANSTIAARVLLMPTVAQPPRAYAVLQAIAATMAATALTCLSLLVRRVHATSLLAPTALLMMIVIHPRLALLDTWNSLLLLRQPTQP